MKKTIIIAGVYTPGIGLSNVMSNLMLHLSETYDIIALGFDPNKQDYQIAAKEEPHSTVYTYPLAGTVGLFRIERKDIAHYIKRYNPVCFITLGPIMSNRYLLTLLQPYRSHLKIISYLALEGKLVDVNYLKYARLIDCAVFYTKSVYNDFNALFLENPTAVAEAGTVRSEHISHGVDKENFYPLSGENDRYRRKEARKIIYGDQRVDEGTFIVLNMNRPSHRKNIEATIAGFKLFLGEKKDALLHLHIGTTEPEIRKKYWNLVVEEGIADYTVITPEASAHKIKSEGWLNTLYNACDVGITTSKGEGWGLGLFEHAATRAAMVAPDHTSFSENWTDAALMVPCSNKHFVFYAYCDMFMVSPEGVAKALRELYFDRDLLNQVTERCYQRAMDSKFDWKNVAKQFKQLIEDVTHERNHRVSESHC